MTALLVVAHGSRKAESNKEVMALAHRLRDAAGGAFDCVEAAFQEWAEPSVEARVAELCAAGATRIVLLPYFLAAGKHVTEDIADAVRRCRDAYPHVSFVVTRHLGALDGIPALILGEAADCLVGPE